MLSIEVAETKMLDSAVLLQIFQCVNVLGVVVLYIGLAMDHRHGKCQNATNELPVELQQVDLVGA